jgi:DNA-binding MarR family transcriptional regulator
MPGSTLVLTGSQRSDASYDERVSRTDAEPGAGYWYPIDEGTELRAIDVLTAFRRYRTAEQAMRKRTRDSMGMGETDLLALRYLLQAQQEGQMLSPRDLARILGISSASVTVLIDRLEKSGHVERRSHLTDRRSIVIVATPGSDEEVRATLGSMHARMLEIAEALPAEHARIVHDFMVAMREAVALVDGHPGDHVPAPTAADGSVAG